eukprot:g3072.t2
MFAKCVTFTSTRVRKLSCDTTNSFRTHATVVYHQIQNQEKANTKKRTRRKSALSGRVDDNDLTDILPRTGAAKITSAEFVKSSVSVGSCPAELHPEFAVIGRSNVGKSSLINLLTHRKKLALISKTPGKTRCINHFLINNKWYLVDLPGYGYSVTSKETRLQWNKFTSEYFKQRGTLANVLLLIDASIPPLPLDLHCANWLAESKIPFTIVFTKVDKRKKGAPGPIENIENFQREFQVNWETIPICFATSAILGDGRDELLKYSTPPSSSPHGLFQIHHTIDKIV